jgi:hypothetical protein
MSVFIYFKRISFVIYKRSHGVSKSPIWVHNQQPNYLTVVRLHASIALSSHQNVDSFFL